MVHARLPALSHTALYAILGGGVGAALIGAGAFAMTGGKGTSPEKRKVKRGLSNAAAGGWRGPRMQDAAHW